MDWEWYSMKNCLGLQEDGFLQMVPAKESLAAEQRLEAEKLKLVSVD